MYCHILRVRAIPTLESTNSMISCSPTQFFTQVYPPELIDLIVEQTNLYAEQRGVTGWVDTTAMEIKAFLGFVMATSVHRVPRLNNIWSSDWIPSVPAPAKIFPRSRF